MLRKRKYQTLGNMPSTIICGGLFYCKNDWGQGTMETMKGLENMEVWKEKVQQDINELKNNHTHFKSDQEKMKADIQDLKMSEKLQDNEINSLKATLNEIKEDTNWIRRKITGALITAVITAIVGGVIGIAVANIF